MHLKIKKGCNLSIAGGIAESFPLKNLPRVSGGIVAVCPDDFHGFMPRALLKEGEEVAAGQPLMASKNYESLSLVSPVSGRVSAVVRGERRKILRVEVEKASGSDKSTEAIPSLDNPENIVNALALSGLLAAFRERPYDVVPSVGVTHVRDIFIQAFDSAPLAPNLIEATRAVYGAQFEDYCRKGAGVLAKISEGKVYVSVKAGTSLPEIPGTERIEIEGPHPSSLASTVINAVRPLNKGEKVWTLSLRTLADIGAYATKGSYSFEHTVAVTGSEVEHPGYCLATAGSAIKDILKHFELNSSHHLRIISGNVLTGTAVGPDGYLRFPYEHITVIPEGDDVDEFMGWASVSPSKMSLSSTFPGKFLHKLFKPDARVQGGRRAMIMSGGFDALMPLDILPEYLLKAIIAKDVEGMERLGIYEVAPEDFALAEFSDTSKMPLQQIVRDGLDYLRKELE